MLLVGILISAQRAQAGELPILPILSTLAGSGDVGIVDGPALEASFIEPYAISYGPDGSLYIVDRAAQRIRKLTSGGMVVTIAGSGEQVSPQMGVEGGFRDGPALEAKFRGPTGIAVGRNGTIYVADAKNHAVREIRDGRVTTVSGSPLTAGHVDGPAAQATFTDPRAIAVDEASLYVADYPNGIRIISPMNVVSTVVPPEPVVTLEVAHFPSTVFHVAGNVLLAASVSSIFVYDLPSFKLLRTIALGWSYASPFVGEGGTLGGPIGSLAALDDRSIAFADPLFRTVRWLALPTVLPVIRALTAEPLDEAPSQGGAYADGPGSASSLVEPTAVARAPDGTLVVADAGARRLRKFSRFDERNQESLTMFGEFPEARSANDVRIAIVGNSYVDMGVPWQAALPGIVEHDVSAAVGPGRTVTVLPVRREGVGPLAALDLIDTYFADGNVKVVVLDYPAQEPTDFIAEQNTIPLAAVLTRLRATDAVLKEHHTAFYVAYHPAAWDIPGEMEYRTLPASIDGESRWENDQVVLDPQSVVDVYRKISRALVSSGVKVIDLWPPFLGNALAGHGIAGRLIADHAWQENAGSPAPTHSP